MFKVRQSFYQTIWILFYLLAFLWLLQHSFSYLDPDFGWHLRLGQEIVQNHQVPRASFGSYTLPNYSFVDHEWLANLTIYLIYIKWGYLWLNILFCLWPLLTIILLNRFLSRFLKINLADRIWPLISLETLSLIAITPHLGVRIQELTLLFLGILVFLLWQYNEKKSIWPLFCLWPLFYLWANLHAGFLIGLVILLLFLASKFSERWLSVRRPWFFIDFSRVISLKQLLSLAGFSLAAIGLTFLTPYGVSLYGFLLGYRDTFYLNHIVEWMPQWSFPYQYWQFSYISFALLAGYFWLFGVFRTRKRKLDIFAAGIFLIFSVLAIKSRRNFPLFFIISFPLLFKLASEELAPGRARIRNFLSFENKILDRSLKFFLVMIFLIVCLGIFIKIRFIKDPFQAFCEDKHSSNINRLLYPCRASAFLATKPGFKEQRLLNDFGWGGYLLWSRPDWQLFIDGRMPQADFNGHSILEEYFNFFTRGRIAAELQTFKIDFALLKKPNPPHELNLFERHFLLIDEQEINQPNELMLYLDSSSDWSLIYQDQISLVYQRVSKSSPE